MASRRGGFVVTYAGDVQEMPVNVVGVKNGAKWGWVATVIGVVSGFLVNALFVGISYGRLSANQEAHLRLLEKIDARLGALEVRDNQFDRDIARLQESLMNDRPE